MTRLLTLNEILLIYQLVMEQSGGTAGIRDHGLLEASLAQPMMTFDGVELYPTLTEKASALGFSLIQNHPFIDGNKRIGYAAMRMFLGRNGVRIVATIDEREATIIAVASGQLSRAELASWLASHTEERESPQ
jgi:death on curing protein